MKCNFLLFLLWFGTLLTAQVKVETITGKINGSGGLHVGPNGWLYIADFGYSLDNANGTKVLRMDYVHRKQPEVFASGFRGASGNDFDAEGNLFQSNIAAGTVSKVTPAGEVSLFASSGLSCNVGVNVDAGGNVYVCNCCQAYGNTIRKITPDGRVSLFSKGVLFACPNGITRGKEGNLYISNFGNGNIIKVEPNGNASFFARIKGGSNGHILYSKKRNILFVASHGSSRIYTVTMEGEVKVLAGSGVRGNEDGSAGESSFSRPNGLALSPSEDTLFVNSSIPVTDAGGRPLNPSVIRMITGLPPVVGVKTTPGTKPIRIEYAPGTGEVFVNGLQRGKVTVHLVSSLGTIIQIKTRYSDDDRLSFRLLEGLLPGIYFLSVMDSMGHSAVRRLPVMAR